MAAQLTSPILGDSNVTYDFEFESCVLAVANSLEKTQIWTQYPGH